MARKKLTRPSQTRARATTPPTRIINSVAPIRICDNGGWTDTWFAEYGAIFNIGVYPYVEAQIEIYPRAAQSERIIIYAENYGERYTRHLGAEWEQHPLLEAAIEYMGVPEELAIQVTLFSDAPAGASTGTSAAVSVALIGALDRLTPGRLTAHQTAQIAHRIETDLLKQQSGIQDQICAAYGGINFIEMFKYPHAAVSQIHVSDSIWWELERRLALVFIGKAHHSSQVHEQVIRELENAGPTARQFEILRSTAGASRDAIYAGDFAALGQAMIRNTEGQRALNAALVNADAQRIIDIARAHGALGWKVNGAGGDGGSLTLLCGDSSHAKRAMLYEIQAENALFQNIPIYLSRYGLRTWEARARD
ncbi:MAG: GHMP kinase [Chloroflexi bacterium UTCFX4]|jgi:D-glycero-alpha-D-manno-heptose-7-phosphate kinase|nr:MAG: GHMP kinase [Chloroflexi bacterium UTCFX4]